MARIGIFGYYRSSNFGDDLMALMLARRVAQGGHEPILLGAGSALAAAASAASVESPHELALASDVLLLGGGAWLSDFDAARASPEQRRADEDCLQLAALAREREIPCLAVSIGGNSTGNSRGVRTGCMSFLLSRHLAGLTTRLRSDMTFVRNTLSAVHGVLPETATFPDVVLALREVLPEEAGNAAAERDPHVFTVAVNVGGGRNAKWLVRGLHYWFGRSRTVRCVYTHNNPSERDSFLARYPLTRGDEHVACKSPLPLLTHLARCDLVIAYKLHLGLAALALGVPFAAFTPVSKACLALAELGWQGLSRTTSPRGLPGLFRELRAAAVGRSQRLLELPRGLRDVQRSAAGHFHWLRERLDVLFPDGRRAGGDAVACDALVDSQRT